MLRPVLDPTGLDDLGLLADTLALTCARDPCKAAVAVLRVACGACRLKTVEELIALGAQVNAPDGQHGPVHSAAWGERPDHIKVLIRAGADITRVDEKGQTALHYAALRKHKPCMQILIKAGVVVNARDTHGRSALFSACQNDHTPGRPLPHGGADRAVGLLLKAGADAWVVDQNGRTAAEAAEFELPRVRLKAWMKARSAKRELALAQDEAVLSG